MIHSYTFYNITNPDGFLRGQPPLLEEAGPFSFVEQSAKFNVSFHEKGRLVSYTTLYQYSFVGDDAQLDQPLNVVNLPVSLRTVMVASVHNRLPLHDTNTPTVLVSSSEP
jgi:hypothetical protein